MTTSDELQRHVPSEATPAQVDAPLTPQPPVFGLQDSGWTADEWFSMLKSLIDSGIGSWKDVTALVLGHLNPSQVGTSLASSDGFKRRYGKGNTMRIVMDWIYNQTGKCADCGSRLELQADHIKGREQYKDPLDADFIENMTLRCRRCNVVRRPSHEFGGLTYLTAESALMWILLVLRPRTFHDYVRMCRLYGMTMSDIRMQEAWAMAHWLAKSEPPAYGIEDNENGLYDLVLWPDSAVTRVEIGKTLPVEATRFYSGVSGTAIFGFFTRQEDARLKFHEETVEFIPFSTYNLGIREPQSLCVRYMSPDRANGRPQELRPLDPRGATLLCHAVRGANQRFNLVSANAPTVSVAVLEEAPPFGRLLKSKIAPDLCRIVAF
jgi:hypothetical protein